jgi:hypothetical protein
MAYKYPICDVFHGFCKIARFFATEPGMVKISWPGKVSMLRTVEDFRREYESCYLSHGITA